MFTVTTYVIFWIIIFFFMGIKWAILDRYIGVKIYRFIYRMTHEHPLPASVERGFIYQQGTKRKLAMATILSTFQSVMALIYSDVNPLVELIMWGLEVPITMMGFYSAPYVYRWWSKKDDLFEWFDDIESGKRSPWSWFTQNWNRTKEAFMESVGQDLAPAQATEKEQPLSRPEEKEQGSVDPREMVQKYINDR